MMQQDLPLVAHSGAREVKVAQAAALMKKLGMNRKPEELVMSKNKAETKRLEKSGNLKKVKNDVNKNTQGGNVNTRKSKRSKEKNKREENVNSKKNKRVGKKNIVVSKNSKRAIETMDSNRINGRKNETNNKENSKTKNHSIRDNVKIIDVKGKKK